MSRRIDRWIGLGVGAVLWLGVVPAAVLGSLPPNSNRVESFALDEDLPSSFILALEQDAEGRLWILDRLGVKVWDGRRLKTYDRNHGLGLTRVGDMVMDEAGRPWLVSGLGQLRLFQLKGDMWERDPGLGMEVFVDTTISLAVLGEDPDILVAVGTNQDGIWLWRRQADGTLGDRFRPEPALDWQGTYVIERWGDRLAVGTEGGLCLLDDQGGLDCSMADGRPILALAVESIAESSSDGAQRLWAWGRNARQGPERERSWIAYREDERWQSVGDSSALPPVDPALRLPLMRNRLIAPDRTGGAYFGDGLSQYRIDREGRVVALSATSSAGPQTGITALSADREHGMWIGTPWGLARIGSRRFSQMDSRHGLLEDEVTAVYQTADGMMVFGHNYGVSVLRDGVVTPLPFPTGEGATITRQRVFDIDSTADGFVWLATFGADIWRLDPGRLELVRYLEAGGRTLERDAVGRLWISGKDRLWLYENGAFEPRAELKDVGTLQWLDIDADGRFLMATQQGLTVWEDGEQSWIYGAEPAVNRLFCVRVLENGEIWLGSEIGPYRLDENGIEPIPGLLEDRQRTIFFIFEHDGKVWLGTDNGVVIWDGHNQRHLSVAHGLAGRETNRGAGYPAPDGSLWIGTDRGVSRYHPAYDHQPPAPSLELRGLEVGGVLRAADRPLRFAHDENGWLFHVETVAFSTEQPMQMRYQLEGFDAEPVGPVELSQTVRYTNLPHGTYRFRVEVGWPGGAWSAPVESAELKISRAFWRRPWFLALMIFSVGSLFLTILELTRRRAIKLERMNRRLHEAAAEREKLIDSLETKNVELERFTFTVSHDLKTPLVTIRGFQGFIRRAVEQGRYDEIVEDLERIDAAADKMGRLLDELLALARVGRVVNLSEQVSLTGLARDVEAVMAAQIREHGVELRIQEDMPEVFGDQARLRMVLQNLVDNAIKFSAHRRAPVVRIEAKRGETHTEWTVSDNGRGIAREHQGQIFGLFKRLDVAGSGTGVGLALVKRIIEAHGGRIEVRSAGLDQGCTFRLLLPHRTPTRGETSAEPEAGGHSAEADSL